jgi:cytochrome c
MGPHAGTPAAKFRNRWPMDSFELNKIMGAVLGTCLFVLSLSIVSGGIFASHPPQKAGYEIAVKDDKAGPAKGPTEPQVPLANLLNEANAEKGASVSRQCVACHEFAKGGANKVGPGLWNVVNNDIGTHAGFAYSNAMKNKKGKWTFEELDKFLENPSKAVPGTSMTFLGVRRATDRAALIVYLSKQADSPVALPPPVAQAPDAQKKDGEKKNGEKKDAPAKK